MDLLFKRYASPFLYIDTLIEMNMLYEGLKKVYENENDTKLWDLYIHSGRYVTPELSYNKWIEKAKSNTHKEVNVSKIQADMMLKETEEFLKNFQL